MKSKRLLSVLMLLLLSAGIFAQSEDEAGKTKEMERRKMVLIESMLADSRELKLGENRAIMFARIGGRLWDLDQKRARDLFQDAISELLGAQAAAEAGRKPGQQNELLAGQSTRPQILQTIATRDAEFALQSFYKSRPALIERAISNSKARNTKIGNHPGTDRQYAQTELQLEQMLIRMAADQNPEKAIALLKAALKSGISGETLGLLQKVFEKDPAAAKDLASEVAGQLARKPFIISDQLDYQTIQVATSILSEHVRDRPATEKALWFDASQMASLAERLIAFHIDKGNQFGYGTGPQIVLIAEKLAPASVEKLKQVEKTMPRYGGGLRYYSQDLEVSRLLNGETPVEQMLTEASKLSVTSRTQIYQAAANRIGSAGDISRARNLLSEYLSDDALENAENSLNWTYTQHLIGADRFAEAEALIDEFPDSNRINALISLANSVFNRDEQKHKSYAAALIEKARAQLPPKPETNAEMSNMIQIISAYSRIEPTEAFRMIDALIQPINEIAEASVIVNGFQGSSYSVRQGEMIVSQGNSLGIYFDTSIFRNLSQIDFDRTLNTIGGLSRREMRLSFKQQLLEGL
ncbi:MAG: hypothetical protein M3449_10070 [Acidobacteriota bacterium]|nr:hypothetical protein [Acidobacteriota bacterium]